MTNEGTNSPETAHSSATRELSAEPDFSPPVKPIAELVARPDFPESILGEHVDIGGYIGVVTAIVKHSIRVRSSEGTTQSFNSYTLRRIYGPRPELEIPSPSSPPPQSATSDERAPAAAPPREIIEEPNFDQSVIPIATLVERRDFPKCTFGQHVDIGGYTGVVVEIVHESLKVRSPQGTSRNYNAPILRKIYAPPSPSPLPLL